MQEESQLPSRNPDIVVGPCITREAAEESDAYCAENLRMLGCRVEEAITCPSRLDPGNLNVIKRALFDYADYVELGCRR